MRLLLTSLAAALLAGCATSTPPLPPHILSTYVVLGEQGVPTARVITDAPACPTLEADGRALPMQVRAAPATIPLRPTASAPEDSKPSAFPVLTCEAPLPAGTRSATVAGVALPAPRMEARRIVVIGDTGCRLKKADHAWQPCNDPEQAPFADVSAAAARWQPDLVVHVGDYHYRENPCPDGNAGCAGSPWGYGWDAWREDFFRPAEPLLRAAPWVVVRGNHETCVRAGQGWWRFLDPRPLLQGRDCNAPADDATGDYSDPYAVPLGGDAQLLVLDTAATSWRGLKPGDTGYARYRDAYAKTDALSQRAAWNLLTNHQPILGFGAGLDKASQSYLQLGDLGLQQAFGAANPMLLPPRVQALLSGHVHLWEQVSFKTDHPSQFVTGFSGTLEDVVPLPDDVSAVQPAPGAVIHQFSAWQGGFGFMTMERTAADTWAIAVHDRHGVVRNRCSLQGRQSSCVLARVE
ncbi:calcineurin-like phosphoesterase family protein [Pseudoduganella flava]|uniref:Calcineurin-like phosphoesterase family protein n=1 Tax=Pseudoduganella flava TaxID=871742 RepID=A0A562PX08_9BURK|nr:metallophosphoesterase [Pseudoduganella flava]QGZ39982.1 metallophosphoesterase [Pseudoduganella flava]TWI48923.1 calcineurin-like phosphoesterase family protein [Pseudoduganella flava]